MQQQATIANTKIKLQEHTLIRVKRFQGIKKTSYTDFQLNTTRLKQDYTEVSGVESPLSKDLDHIEEFPHSLRKIDRLQSNDSNAVFICYCKGVSEGRAREMHE